MYVDDHTGIYKQALDFIKAGCIEVMKNQYSNQLSISISDITQTGAAAPRSTPVPCSPRAEMKEKKKR